MASLLDVTPGFGSKLSRGERRKARRALVARTIWLGRGEWDEQLSDPCLFGIVVLEGALVRRVVAGKGRVIELLTEGDLVRPWQQDSASFVGASFFALMDSRVAMLDREFASAVCEWPSLVDALIERAVRRTHGNATQAALRSYTGIERRIVFCLWHLAARCGVETEDGIEVPLPLTHQLMADLVGAHRPAVSSALSRLVAAGELRRTGTGGWVLDPDLAEQLPAPENRVEASAGPLAGSGNGRRQ